MTTSWWNEQRDALLRKLAAQKLTSGEIAKELGTTRNSIVSRARRIAAPLISREFSHRVTKVRAAVPAPPTPPPKRPPPPPPKPRAIPSSTPAPAPIVDAVSNQGVRLLDLPDRGACRWPTDRNQEGVLLYCGAKCTGTYCNKHLRMRN